MDYKFLYSRVISIIVFSLVIFQFYGCSEKDDTANTYYIEMINFKDTLKKYVSNNIIGKVSFIKNDRRMIVSVNYIEDDYPDMHYYKSVDEITKTIKPDSKKIRIELVGNYTTDSTMYSIQRFKYNKNEWVKISDMGFIKPTATNSVSKELAIDGLGNQIITNLVASTY